MEKDAKINLNLFNFFFAWLAWYQCFSRLCDIPLHQDWLLYKNAICSSHAIVGFRRSIPNMFSAEWQFGGRHFDVQTPRAS